jgi:hypothetical protein
MPFAYNRERLQAIIKSGHFIGLTYLLHSVLAIFFSFRKSKDAEVFSALKIAELIQKLNRF